VNTFSIADLLSQLKGTKKTGNNSYSALCPSHDDKNNSLSLKFDESDGKILLHCHAGCTFDEITAALGIEKKQLMGNSGDNGNGKLKKLTISDIYDYTDENGYLIYQVVRFIPKTFRQRRPDPHGRDGWTWNLTGVKPTLFKLQELMKAISTGKAVCIVEGEKDVLNLAKIGITATCNSGGAGKWPKNESRRFKGAKVIIIPDNDKPGTEHAHDVAQSLNKYASEIKILKLPDVKDISDWIQAGGTKKQLTQLVMDTPVWEPPPEPEPIKPGQQLSSKLPFRLIGYNDGCHYYLPHEDLQIIRLSPDQHTQSALINLAPLQWWETNFPSKTGPDYNAAKNWLFRASKNIGIYDTRRLRGCGTWFDEGRVVQHFGDRLIVDGQETQIQALNTRYIYNASYPIEIERANHLNLNQAHKFLDICRMPSWEKHIYGTLLAGWCVVAPICGALSWRPHIWMSGASGTGKSWIIDEIIKPVIGDIKLQAQSNSTEAGIRQALGINAFPVLFDEAEGEDTNARIRLQGIIDLMRQSSSETGAPIIKGTQGGRAMIFHIRSCFMLASIGPNVDHKADKSRISILSLIRPHPKDTIDLFDNLKEEVKIITLQWCASFRARTLTLIPVILENALTFGRAIAQKFNDQRIGDQLGILLAGAYSLTSDSAITEKKAAQWIDTQDWEGEGCIDDESDERMCLNHILEYVISYNIDNQRIEKSIANIVYEKPIGAHSEQAIERIGIRVIDDRIVISDSHSALKSILKNTPFEKNWAKYLRRLPETEQKAGVKFNGIINRATAIPYDVVFLKDEG
jgi:putative DNA primase/helicase